MRAVQLASELRQLEAQQARLVASLGLDVEDDDDPPAPKSAQHQAAQATAEHEKAFGGSIREFAGGDLVVGSIGRC